MFRLALALGKTVGELEHSLSDAELSEWIEFYSLEPFPQDRSELQLASLSSIVYNYMAKKPLSPSDFMISQVEKVKKQKKGLEDDISKCFEQWAL